jgi:ABC-2 type transport system ATP-binding protein
MAEHIIETFGISKKYKLKRKKEILALNNINLSIKKGEIFGLLGPNGTGKTTLIQILTTLILPTTGYATIDGYNIIKNPKHAKSRISLMLGDNMLYNRITGYDNLKFSCKLFYVPNYKEKIKIIAKDLELDKWLNQYVEKYSSGMRMKLALCRTLLLNRKIMFLDEPTLGLDVNTTSFIINKLKQIKSTIILTSHDMTVVEKLCDRVAFISNGEILKIGSQKALRTLQQTEIKFIIKIFESKDQLKLELKQQDFIGDVIENKEGFVISLNARKNFKDLLFILANYNVLTIKEHEYSLEELFIKIVNNN